MLQIRYHPLQLSSHSMCAAALQPIQRRPEVSTAQVCYEQLQTCRCCATDRYRIQPWVAAAYHKSLGHICLDVALLHLLLHQLLDGYKVRIAKDRICIHLITAEAQQGL